MKKITIRAAGSYDKLTFEEAPDLQPRDNEVVINVKAIGINFADICIRLGVYQSAKEYVGWPITPGFEVSGIVKSVGAAVKKYSVGQKVIGFTRFNGYATQVCVIEDHVLPIPKGFTINEAAGFPAVFFTAYHAIFQNVVLRPKSLVLVHSAAGGVGTALTQLCKAAGFFVVGVIGSSHKREYLEKFGPDVIIDKSKQDLWIEAQKACPGGYHAIFDANGFSTLKDSYRHLRPTGKLIVYGSHSLFSQAGGKINYLKAGFGLLKTPKFAPLDMISRNKGVVGFNLSFLFDQADLINDCIEGLDKHLENGTIKPIPVTQFDFEKVADAHRLIESGKSVGKIILRV
ncbi:synaptic vesicle VAT-1 family membrane protein [Kaarinaea lacus]